MRKTHFLSKNENLILLYRTYANKLNKIKYIAKKTCFNKMFDQYKSDIQTTRQIIKSLLPNVKDSSPSIHKIVAISGGVLEDVLEDTFSSPWP